MKTLRKGFTLIELLIVIVIIGIIASIALPKFSDVKSQAYRSTLQSDLRTAMTQQELAVTTDGGTYFMRTLSNATDAAFTPSQGVSYASGSATPLAGYIAGVNHARLTTPDAQNAFCVSGGIVTALDRDAFVTAAAATPANPGTPIVAPALADFVLTPGRQLPCGA